MSIVDHNQDIIVPYSIEDTFEALKKAVPNLPPIKTLLMKFER